MPYLCSIPQSPRSRVMTDRFAGYCHTLSAADGRLYEGENLSCADYPALSTRARRGTVLSFGSFGGILAKGQLARVDGGTLYYAGQATPVTGLARGRKQLVSMGAYICIFPDKMYYNTEDAADYGSMEARYMSPGESSVIRYEPCLSDGTVLEGAAVSAEAPEEPADGELWIRSSDSARFEYSSLTLEWTPVTELYTKISFSSMGQLKGFGEYDGVRVSGAFFDGLNGSKIIYACGGSANEADWLVLAGGTPGAYTQNAGHIEIERSVPELDFVIECQNRLWGCYYGMSGNGVLNELYCSALGDFKNWSRYSGVSTDSWTASVGSDGEWTGAVNYLGCPTFFKESSVHRVIISPNGAHQTTETPCRGVQKGSSDSLSIVDETLYYKSPSDVCAWQGGFPVTVSEELGDESYSSAAAGSFGRRYYISMKDAAGGYRLFVYDTAKKLWMPEDSLKVLSFAEAKGDLYAAAELEESDPDSGEARTVVKLLSLGGTEGEAEESFHWSAESGLQTFNMPDRKYVSRFDIRLQLEPGARCGIFLQYDSDGVWVPSGRVCVNGRGSCTVPVRPRRCDHFRIKLAGTGAMKLFSVTRVLEYSS